MKTLVRAVIQVWCLPAVPLMALFAWAGEHDVTILEALRFAWDWWLGFWEVA